MVHRLLGFASNWLFGWGGLAVSMVFYASVLVSPGVFWPGPFMGFAIPWIMLGNLLAAGFLLVKRRYMRVIFPLLGLVPAIWFLPATFQVSIPKKPAVGQPSLRVLSYNMASLAGKRWRPEMRRQNARDMMNWVLKEEYDLMILQEFYENPAVPEYTPLEQLHARGYHNILFSNKKRLYADKGYGLAIVSRYPLSNLQVWERQMKTNNQILTCEMHWLGVRYRIINVHLQSNKLTWAEIGIKRTPEELRRNFFSVLGKLRIASKKRAKQVETLCKLIRESPYPVILAGDFNDTPFSYTYWQVRRELTSSFERAGRGFGFTYNGKLPGLRIDHQFYGKELECLDLRTHHEIDLSDHFPITGIYVTAGQR